MFFILSKLFYIFLNPLVWIVICFYFAFFSKKELRRKRGKWTGIALLFFFSNSAIYLEFCRAWEVHNPPISTIKNYDVGIVLGGMFEYDSNQKILSIRRGGDRIWQALNLYKKGKIKKIFISGDSGYVTDRGLHEASQLKENLIKLGIPANDILFECKSKNTYENAIETEKVLKKKGLSNKKLLLITSGRHMKRAKGCFDNTKLKVDTYSTDLYTGKKRFFFWEQLLVPNFETINDWHGLIKEWVGYLVYSMTGKI